MNVCAIVILNVWTILRSMYKKFARIAEEGVKLGDWERDWFSLHTLFLALWIHIIS